MWLTVAFHEGTKTNFQAKEDGFVKDAVRRLNIEYGFNLTEGEIDLVAKQAEDAERLFQPLFEVDLTGIVPLTKIDKGTKRAAPAKKESK